MILSIQTLQRNYMSKGSLMASVEWQTSWTSAKILSLLAIIPCQTRCLLFACVFSEIPAKKRHTSNNVNNESMEFLKIDDSHNSYDHYLSRSERKKTEKFRPGQESNPDFCNASTELY